MMCGTKPENPSKVSEEDVSFSLDTILFPNPQEDACPISEPHIVIYADARTDRVYAMNMHRDVKPNLFSYTGLLDAIKQRVILKVLFQVAEYMLISDLRLTEAQLTTRDRKMKIIQPVLDELESFLMSRSYGQKIIRKALEHATKHGIPKIQRTEIYKHLYRYWRCGSRANAFLRKPGSGQSKNKTYRKKTGPKRIGTKNNGHMVTEEDKTRIIKTLKKHVFIDTPKSLPRAYDELMDLYYSDPKYDYVTGEISEYEHWTDDRAISLDQFKYHALKYLDLHVEDVRKRQRKDNVYKKDIAGLAGNINEYFGDGPGQVYQVDETPLAIELVCEFDKTRQRRVGRPTAYSVVDQFSKAIVALLLTLNRSSAHTAYEVMYIAFSNKKKFCEELGIKLQHPWPQEGKCQMLFVDNAEFKADLTRSLSKDAQVNVLFNKEGNSQQKGAVERNHKTLEDFLFSLVPGVSKKKVDEFLKRTLRYKALLHRRELYEILIDFITTRNEFYTLESIVLTKEMRRDDVPRIPNRVWEWGKKYRAGYIRPVNDTELQIELLEVGEVTVRREYLYLPGEYIKTSGSKQASKGIKYLCDSVLLSGLQDVRKGRQLPRLQCRFKRYSMDRILLDTKDGYKVANIHPDEKLYQHMDAEDIHRDKAILSAEERDLRVIHSSKQSHARVSAEKIVSLARKEQVPISKHQANSQDIRENRQITVDHENQLIAERHEKMLDQFVGEEPHQTKAGLQQAADLFETDKSEPSNETAATFRQLRKSRKP